MCYLKDKHKLSIKQACILLGLCRSRFYYKQQPKDDSLLIKLLNELAGQHPMYGFNKLYQMIRQRGYEYNHKRVYRVYKLLKMNLQKRVRKRLPMRVKTPLIVPSSANQIWSIDFMSDTLRCGRRIRTLNIIDDYNREALCLHINYSIPAYSLITKLEEIIHYRGKPMQIRTDNGTEFTSNTFINFCNEQNIEICYIQAGKPMQNGFIERFNRTYRTEILDSYIFSSIKEARALTDEWLYHYNENRPHESLQNMTPNQYHQMYLLKKDNSANQEATHELSPFQQIG